MSQPEPKVTGTNLEAKWTSIQKAVTRQAEQKMWGLSVTTLGLLALGAVALGTAFWLGRRSVRRAEPRRESADSAPGPAIVRHQSLQPGFFAQLLTPLVETAVKAGVNVVTTKLNAPKEGEGKG